MGRVSRVGAKVQDGRQAQGQAEWSGGRVQGQDRQGSKTRRSRKREAGKRQELTGQTLVSLTNKNKLAQTDRKHRYKYPENKWGRWATPRGGGDKHKDR